MRREVACVHWFVSRIGNGREISPTFLQLCHVGPGSSYGFTDNQRSRFSWWSRDHRRSAGEPKTLPYDEWRCADEPGHYGRSRFAEGRRMRSSMYIRVLHAESPIVSS
jgi:hypothetical protein